MPGYYLHLAACKKNALKNRSFVLGVEAPDILKKHVKVCGGIEAAHAKYDSIRTGEMPEYYELQPRILQKESSDSNEGLHFGLSSKPDIRTYWSGLSETQKANPFYRGYAWHLITDAVMYARLNINAKIMKVLQEKEGNENFEEVKIREREKLHADWDKTNSLVRDNYPEVTLPDEVKELGVVQFIEGGDLVYVDWKVLKDTIEYLRTFDPLNGHMDSIIEDVLKSI